MATKDEKLTREQDTILEYIFLRIGDLDTPDLHRHHLGIIGDALIIRHAREWLPKCDEHDGTLFGGE